MGQQFKGTIEGNLTVIDYLSTATKTNTYSITVRLVPPDWEAVLVNDKSHTTNEIYSYSGTTYSLYRFAVSTNGEWNNNAAINVYPGNRPFSSGYGEDLWAALVSGPYFKAHKPPFDDIGLRIDGACLITAVDIKPGDVSPRLFRWHNKAFDLHTSGHLFEGEFTWLTETNVTGFALPLESELKMTSATNQSTDKQLRSTAKLVLTKIGTETTGPIVLPKFTGMQAVDDYRYLPDSRRSIPYTVKDGLIPPTNSPPPQALKQLGVFQKIKQGAEISKRQKEAPRTRMFILIAFVLISGVFLMSVAAKTNKPKGTE